MDAYVSSVAISMCKNIVVQMCLQHFSVDLPLLLLLKGMSLMLFCLKSITFFNQNLSFLSRKHLFKKTFKSASL
jgi:hypothetical protein